MGKEKAPKTSRMAGIASWFDGLKQEFRKIVWPDQKTVARQTAAVIIVSIVTGVVIALLDWIIQYGVNFLVEFSI